MNTSSAGRLPRVVIVGAGFAGLYAAKALRRALADVVVVDRNNHHVFQPLLYQVAAAALSPGDIAHPIRSILRRQRNTRVIMAEAREIDRGRRKVVLDIGEIDYDYLILAPGVVTDYFGKDQWEQLAPGLKDIRDGLEIRRRILSAFEAAEVSKDPDETRALLTFVVVGGGSTGVEIAGAIQEIASDVMRRDFRNIEPELSRVLLIEASPRVLPSYPERLSKATAEALGSMGVEVTASSRVDEITKEGVRVGDGFIPSRTVIWAAGVKAPQIAQSLGVEPDRRGRVIVNRDLTIPGDERVFVAGDLAHFDRNGRPLPELAPVAIQQGKHAARNVMRALKGKTLLQFHYFDHGQMATIGRNRAVVDSFGLRLTGRLAWLAWLFIHIMYLIGFRSRLSVLIQWAYAYIAFRRSARLIIPTQRTPGPGRGPST